MERSTLIKLFNHKNYYQYLRENSFWIKELNRGDKAFLGFDDFVKDKYSLRGSDKVNKAINAIDMASNILKVLK